MKKKLFVTVILMISLAVAATSVYAITRLIAVKSKRSSYKKAVIFNIDMDDGFLEREIIPGEATTVNPMITSQATEMMYAFIKIKMPNVGVLSLYTYKVNNGWTLVEEVSTGNHTEYVYAYAENQSMTELAPGEETTTLTDSLRMRGISIADYAAINDINVELTGYAIGISGMSSDPNEAWIELKNIVGSM